MCIAPQQGAHVDTHVCRYAARGAGRILKGEAESAFGRERERARRRMRKSQLCTIIRPRYHTILCPQIDKRIVKYCEPALS